jgi:hypothetical protein
MKLTIWNKIVLALGVSSIAIPAFADENLSSMNQSPPALTAESAVLSKNANSTPVDSTESYAGKLGAGINIGEPMGASLKYWLNDAVAVDGVIGGSYNVDANNEALYVAADVLWHNFELIPVSQGRLPVYFGIGGLARINKDNQGSQEGIRAPVGLSYMFAHAPIDVFVEVAPALDVAPFVCGDITGGIGIRYWF